MDWQRAFVLHRKPYSETSLLIEFFTEQHGKMCALAKGARRLRSTWKGCLQPFTPLVIRWSGKGAVKTLLQVEAVTLTLPLTGSVLYSGLYVNELLVRMLEDETAYPVLFIDYLHCLQALAATDKTPQDVLRCFELALLFNLGYGIDFLHCAGSNQPVSDDMTYQYQAQQGFVASLINNHYTFTGKELRAMALRQFPDEVTLKAAKRFIRIVLSSLLGSKPLKSRELFIQNFKRS